MDQGYALDQNYVLAWIYLFVMSIHLHHLLLLLITHRLTIDTPVQLVQIV